MVVIATTTWVPAANVRQQALVTVGAKYSMWTTSPDSNVDSAYRLESARWEAASAPRMGTVASSIAAGVA